MANNRWTNFVREWAGKNGMTYGCALSDPAMREEYKVKYGNRKRLTQTKEKEMMGQEDKDAIELVIEEVAPKKGKKGRPAKYATAEEARQAKIKNTIEARKRKKQGQKEVLSEAKEAEMMSKEDINRARKKVMRPPSGPPPISAEMVQRAKAKKDYSKFSPFQGTPQMGMFEAFASKSGKGFNPLPEFAEQVEGAESGGGIQHLPDGCVLYTGGGIFGKKFDRFVKKTIGKKATKTIYKALDKTVKPLVNRGIDVGINALGAVQPELIPALQVGKKVLKGYIDRPTAYQENPTKELVKDINPVGLAVDYALGGAYSDDEGLKRMIGGHWTEQMKPYLERELRNYKNIVHHLGQHLSESGPKDPKDAMGYSHFGNEMRRVQKLLSTI